MFAAIFNLNGHAGYVHVWVIELSVPNLIVIALMLVVFVVALLAPFPGATKGRKPS
jgi:hypothetical protein